MLVKELIAELLKYPMYYNVGLANDEEWNEIYNIVKLKKIDNVDKIIIYGW